MVLEVASPAKLNLFLAVGPKDAAGYHPIRTIFQAIGLYDDVAIDLDATATSVEFTGADIPPENTVTKAIRLMSEFCVLPNMAIRIDKHIPTEAGLGGGSSNAAAAIRAVRHLVPERFTERDAFSVAEAVGADVPFFLIGGCAKGEGYGERLTPLPNPLEERWALVVKPEYGHSTKEMYAALDEMEYPFAEFPGGDVRYNDFERYACDVTDRVERLLVFGADSGGMTGSGSALFGLFSDRAKADQAKARAETEQLGQAWLVPLLSRAQSLAIHVRDS
jgi:4-diphosphocytidyl-2-C-methyl-D-erythritol kinase